MSLNRANNKFVQFDNVKFHYLAPKKDFKTGDLVFIIRDSTN